jgi:hypothetical protein
MQDVTPLARRLIDRVADRNSIPRYGSPEWDSLPDQDPRRAAAVMVAAESWRDHTSLERIAEDMAAELQREDDAVRRRFKEASLDVWETRTWNCYPSARMPTRAELQRRRGEAA